eukprot:TRINITY_DN1572_c0_g1_i5.p1 TRINITY_DN1572_c0_g1~~TRINITY_DN1572_c0_g1_i5.p1  ORF type:complete len:588 (+),score=137.38 TRINITY_DN1572_c0_g1_i5:13-1776(+)
MASADAVPSSPAAWHKLVEDRMGELRKDHPQELIRLMERGLQYISSRCAAGFAMDKDYLWLNGAYAKIVLENTEPERRVETACAKKNSYIFLYLSMTEMERGFPYKARNILKMGKEQQAEPQQVIVDAYNRLDAKLDKPKPKTQRLQLPPQLGVKEGPKRVPMSPEEATAAGYDTTGTTAPSPSAATASPAMTAPSGSSTSPAPQAMDADPSPAGAHTPPSSGNRTVSAAAATAVAPSGSRSTAPVPQAMDADQLHTPPGSGNLCGEPLSSGSADGNKHEKMSRSQLFLSVASQSGGLVYVEGRPYMKLEVIGKGGSSKVYKVLDQSYQIFALKHVSLHEGDPATLLNYENEIAILRRLQRYHCVIRLVASEVLREQQCINIVLEYGETDLAKLLSGQASRGGSGIDENSVRLYWQQMLEAVHCIHEERVIHADLKPANFVMVKSVLKLIDFGIAKQIVGDTTNIVRESQVGTVNYISPEVLMEQSSTAPVKIGRSSDVWSLGCILYQMCFGKPPFSHLPLMQKLRCIVDPHYQIEYPPSTNEALLDVLQACLQREPQVRPSIPALQAHPFLRPTYCPHCRQFGNHS